MYRISFWVSAIENVEVSKNIVAVWSAYDFVLCKYAMGTACHFQRYWFFFAKYLQFIEAAAPGKRNLGHLVIRECYQNVYKQIFMSLSTNPSTWL